MSTVDRPCSQCRRNTPHTQRQLSIGQPGPTARKGGGPINLTGLDLSQSNLGKFDPNAEDKGASSQQLVMGNTPNAQRQDMMGMTEYRCTVCGHSHTRG